MKEGKISENKLNEMERTNLPDRVQSMVIKMFNGLERRVDERSENFKKEIKNI